MKKLYIFIFIITIFIGCKTNHEKYSYFSNGKIHEKFVFPTWNDKKTMLNYTGTLYYENGNTECKITKKNGRTDGDYLTFYDNGKMSNSIMYKNDTLDGVCRSFTENGKIFQESLYIKGTHLVKMKVFGSDTNSVNVFYYMGNKQEDDIGRIVFNKSGEPDSSKCFYYITFGKDSINEGEDYSLNIVVYTFNIKNYIKVAEFGDFDPSFKVKDSSKIISLSSNNNHLNYNFKPKNKGHNLIIGKIFVKNLPNSLEELDRDFIFYKDFYVKQR